MLDQPHTEKADVYSFALVLYELVARQPPYKDIDTWSITTHVATKKK